jgi:hypothetical protein
MRPKLSNEKSLLLRRRRAMTIMVKPMDDSISPAAISPRSPSKVLIVYSDEYAKAPNGDVMHIV